MHARATRLRPLATAGSLLLLGCAQPWVRCAGDPEDGCWQSWPADLHGLMERQHPSPGRYGMMLAEPEPAVIDRVPCTGPPYRVPDVSALWVMDMELGVFAVPPERAEIRCQVVLDLAAVSVRQVFRAPAAREAGAFYVFPLPNGADVTRFSTATCDGRMRSGVRERDALPIGSARDDRASAPRWRGEQSSVFTHRFVALSPGERIEVELDWIQTLPWRDRALELVVPAVMAPPFQQTGPDPAERALSPPSWPEPHRLDLEIVVHAALPWRSLESPSHAIELDVIDGRRSGIRIRDEPRADRDFVLRLVPQEGVAGAVVVHREAPGADGFFSMLVLPPERTPERVAPLDVVFVVDCSGSMVGRQASGAGIALRSALAQLRDGDAFGLIRFSDVVAAVTPRLVPATPATLRAAIEWVDELPCGGRSIAAPALMEAWAIEERPGRRRLVALLTDGGFADGPESLRAVAAGSGDARLLVIGLGVGLGVDVDRRLLGALAAIGRGRVAHADGAGAAAPEAANGLQLLAHPLLVDPVADWGDARPHAVEPEALPDLLADRPLVARGRVRGVLPPHVRVVGRSADGVTVLDLPVVTVRHGALAKAWARARLRSLGRARLAMRRPRSLDGVILEIALEHGLASERTELVGCTDARCGPEVAPRRCPQNRRRIRCAL